ncbi:MAG: hypothetical protein GF401_15500, partial [Chitinivibrionales bacterium]|nr:hypothetical protein [Chitinivibrionales bacterium]
RNRRKPDTLRIEQFCPSWIEHHGKVHNAFLAELSGAGAKFIAPEAADRLFLRKGEEITVDIWTRHGVTSCKGIVRWSSTDGSEHRWGIEFSELSQDAGDPIRVLLRNAELYEYLQKTA